MQEETGYHGGVNLIAAYTNSLHDVTREQVMQDCYPSYIGHEDELAELPETKAAFRTVMKVFGGKIAEQQHLFPDSQDAKFQQWFKGSKVVDKEGNPLPVYHGTRSSVDFDTFAVDGPPMDEDDYFDGQPTSSGSGADPTSLMGAHFAVEPNVANQFAEGRGWTGSRYEGESEMPRVIKVFLRITNPKDFGSEHNLREFINQGKVSGDALDIAMEADDIQPMEPEQEEAAQEWYSKYENDQSFRVEQNQYLFERAQGGEGYDDELREAAYELASEARQRLEMAGYDGIRYKNVVEGGTAWIAFAPNQVKSAWAQEFNPRDPRFTASKEASQKAERWIFHPDYGVFASSALIPHAALIEEKMGKPMSFGKNYDSVQKGYTFFNDQKFDYDLKEYLPGGTVTIQTFQPDIVVPNEVYDFYKKRFPEAEIVDASEKSMAMNAAAEKTPFRMPTTQEIVSVLRKHPLIRLKHRPKHAFLVGSFSKNQQNEESDVDILLEIDPVPGETAEQVETEYRRPLQKYFMQNSIRGKNDAVHPQWCGRRVDLYFTYDADAETRPKVMLAGGKQAGWGDSYNEKWVYHPDYGAFSMSGNRGYHAELIKDTMGKNMASGKNYDEVDRGYAEIDRGEKTVRLYSRMEEGKWVPNSAVDLYKKKFPDYTIRIPEEVMAGWAKKAAGFAFKSFKKLWHIGTFDPKEKGKGSLEGAGLSVSVNPEEWQYIARLGGDLWELAKPGNRFVNFHRVTKAQKKQITNWGTENGYVEPIELYRAEWWDEEDQETRYSDFIDEREAKREVGGMEGMDAKYYPVPGGGLNPTEKLVGRSKQLRGDPMMAWDMLLTVYAEDELDCDGVWWDDKLDQYALSAPRGVIFANKVPSWTKKKVQAAAGQFTETASLDLQYYMEEGCGMFAMALSQFHPNSEIKVISDTQGERWSESIPFELSHVYCSTPSANYDVRGARSVQQMADGFGIQSYRVFGWSPQEFMRKFMGMGDKPLYGEKADIEEAKQIILANSEKYGLLKTAAATKPSATQLEALEHMAGGKPLYRYPGGFWTTEPIVSKDTFGIPKDEKGETIWYVPAGTMNAMEKRGWIVRANKYPEPWKDDRVITDAGLLYVMDKTAAIEPDKIDTDPDKEFDKMYEYMNSLGWRRQQSVVPGKVSVVLRAPIQRRLDHRQRLG